MGGTRLPPSVIRPALRSDPEKSGFVPALLARVAGQPEGGAFGAHAVGELDRSAVANVDLDWLPGSDFVTNFFAGGANGQDAGEHLRFGEGLLKIGSEPRKARPEDHHGRLRRPRGGRWDADRVGHRWVRRACAG